MNELIRFGIGVVNAIGRAVTAAIEFVSKLVSAFFKWIFDFFRSIVVWRIEDSEEVSDSAPVSVPAQRRKSATAMSIALHPPRDSYTDSGTRWFFALNAEGRASFWTLDPESGVLEKGISYHHLRKGEALPGMRFDMIAANSGRVFAKRRDKTEFYFAMMEPMFRNAAGEDAPSLYFKIDPEKGQPGNNLQHLMDHFTGTSVIHPATLRMPLFRLLLGADATDMLAVNVDRHLRTWHRIDARPPRDGADPLLDGLPVTTPVIRYGLYINVGFFHFRIATQDRRGYAIKEVLDIGVGHEHWHEHSCSVYGGEIDSLDGPGLLFTNYKERKVYQLFNGPVTDQGGFVDGTVNYYLLCQFKEIDMDDLRHIPPDAFGILWLDEQAALSERWRLLHPDDSLFGGFRDLVPSALVQYLSKTPEYGKIRFDGTKYFCPFRAGFILPQSRMVVSRQVIVLGGYSMAADEPRLYSINTSFGTGDRTWRWRSYPPELPPSDAPSPVSGPGSGVVFAVAPRPMSFASGTTTVGGGGTTSPLDPVGGLDSNPPYIPSGVLGLREDMTLFVGLLQPNASSPYGYYFQSYLPATGLMVPDSDNLKLPSGAHRTVAKEDPLPTCSEPNQGFSHPWNYLPATVFEFVHTHYSHFGVYEPVDSRSQFYAVDLNSYAGLDSDQVQALIWEEQEDQLVIKCDCLDWSRLNGMLNAPLSSEAVRFAEVVMPTLRDLLVGAFTPTEVQSFMDEAIEAMDAPDLSLITKRHHKGLFHSHFQLRLAKRGDLGWILMHADKRDDDLLAFSDFTDRRAKLRERGGPRTVEVTLRRHVPGSHPTDSLRMPVLRPPIVSEAGASVLNGKFEIWFRTPLGDTALKANLFRVKLGWLLLAANNTGFAGERIVFDAELGAFTRVPGDTTRLVCNDPGSLVPLGDLAAACTMEARYARGTSIWFVGATGKAATAEVTSFG